MARLTERMGPSRTLHQTLIEDQPSCRQQIDSTVMLVLFGVKLHEKASFAFDDLRSSLPLYGSGPLGAKGGRLYYQVRIRIRRVLEAGSVSAGRLFHS